MKLKIDTNGLVEPPKIGHRPSGDWITVPSGFRKALREAGRFRGQHNAIYPWIKYVYLVKGKLYASNNRCIIEIDLGDDRFGDAQFIAADVKLIQARKVDPCEAQLSQACVSFAWPDGTWCKLDRRDAERNVNFHYANRCRSLIERFWHEEGRGTDVMRKAIVSEVKRSKGRGEILKFSHHDLAEPADQYWHGGTIEKVIGIADTFDPDASPAPFSFPNGKGLIVKPSERKAT